MLTRKSKFFLMAGIAALCISCSDDSNSLNASDSGKDDDKVADKTVIPNPNIETADGATFETKGKRAYNDYGTFEEATVAYDS